MSQNLWPTIKISDIITPSRILEEQATFLAENTNNILKGQVLTYPNKYTAGEFIIDFYIIAPALQNFRYELLEVRHSLLPIYPAVIQFREYDIICESQQYFEKELAQILRDEHTQSVISTLISQSGVDAELAVHFLNNAKKKDDAIAGQAIPDSDLPF